MSEGECGADLHVWFGFGSGRNKVVKLLIRSRHSSGRFVRSLVYMHFRDCVIIRKRSKFRQIMKTLYGAKTVFARSAITPPKVNRFGWNLEHCELYST